ncbi:MAG: radical SAM protein [Candidatus Omnitrophica bacterium]|nr:radical SAM protein [Candidatus Omnitrophota bacterium]
MPSTIPLQDSVVYGPIASRRFGNSLGINVLPTDRKVCSSNCVYCQYGWTLAGAGKEPLKRAPELLIQIQQGLKAHVDSKTQVDCLTLAGNGEPTLHPELLELVVGIKQLRDRFFPKAPVGILSDATQIHRPRVRQALELLEVRCLKFDAADEHTWRRINDPLGPIDFNRMLEELHSLPEIILQSMFIQGNFDNTDEPHLKVWIKAVGKIKPKTVQVYTVDRGTAADGIQKVSKRTLQEIANRLHTATGILAEVYE